MRKTFFKELDNIMQINDKVWAVTGDLGKGGFDQTRDYFPGRFINVGAAEQAGLDICVGLALSGKIPFFYTITPFLLRGFETLRTYVNFENIKVILVGSGRDKEYEHDGISHWASDIPNIMDSLPKITQLYPEDKDQIPAILEACILKDGPSFISLRR
jgi:transketolase